MMIDVDVLVVGSGFAGLVAAIEAATNGASVLVLEKMKAAGGNSIISDGGFAGLGEHDSPEQFYDDVVRAGQGLNEPELARILVENARDALAWSRDFIGVKYLERLEIFGGHSVARCYTAKGRRGASIIRPLLRKLDELGVPIRYQSRLETIRTDARGRVTGVLVRDGYDFRDPAAGTEVIINARRGVVLATGGFGADIAFRTMYDSRLTADVDTTNKPFATAETLLEAMRLGAATRHLSRIQLGPWASPDEKGYGEAPGFADYIVFPYGIIIDPSSGRRVANELADRKLLADSLLEVGHPCIGMADAQAVKQSGWNLDQGLKKGVLKVFDTLQAFAAGYGIDYDELGRTLARFNRFVEKGSDRDFAKPLLADARPVRTAPYFGVRLWPKVHYTMGGLAINAGSAVLDAQGKPLAGLFAAGELVGGVHGACRLGSCSITECFVFGRIAGKSVAKHESTV